MVVVVQGANIDDIYGSYFPVMFFPTSGYIPYCVRYEFSKNPPNIHCTCADGKNSTLVDVRMVEALNPDGPIYTFQPTHSDPILAVDTAEEVNPSLNVSCTCEGKEYRTRVVVRKVNKNYILLYAIDYGMSYYNDVEKNTAQLMAQKLPGNSELLKDLALIEELKHRHGAALCTREVYEQFNSRNKV